MWNPFAKNSASVKQSQQNIKASTQMHLRIAEIRDNTVILKNGGLRAILKVSSINFNLKSEDEQKAIIFSYQSFLNTIEFPIEVIIRSRKLELDAYIDKLKILAEKQANGLLQRQTREYIEYIQKLIEFADIMEKEFYVVVPIDPARAVKASFMQKFWGNMHPADSAGSISQRHQEFDNLKKNLSQRVSVVGGGLENCGLKVSQLITSELIALFYQIYNPLTARNEKVENSSSVSINSDAELGRA